MAGNSLGYKWKLGACTVAVSALVACDDAGGFAPGSLFAGADDTAPAAQETGSVTLVEQDVESPEVFGVTENGLWDGRPSLGGVWVAHPDVSDPERVIIRNEANGKFVIGALFRRERENPGPRLQVSSDAAETLGMLAGAPSQLNVVALRRQEVEVDATPQMTTTLPEPAAIAATPLDPVTEAPAPVADVAEDSGADATLANAAAAIAAVEAATTAASAPAASAPVSASVPAPAPAAGSLTKPYIQIGIFSIEANATRTAELMRGNGLSTRVLAQESQGRAFWRVIVGPAPTAADRGVVLEKVKSLGFADAYAVTN